MILDDLTYENGVVVTLAVIAFAGFLVVSTGPALAQSDGPFGDSPFGDGSDSPFGDSPFGDGSDSPFGDGTFGDGTDGPSFNFSEGDDGGFSFPDPGEGPSFNFSDGEDGTGFSFPDPGEGPSFNFSDGEDGGFSFPDPGEGPSFNFSDDGGLDFNFTDPDDGDDEDGPFDGEKNVSSISLSLSSSTLEVGQSTQTLVWATYEDGSSESVTLAADISSNDTSVATVSGSYVTSQAAGKARITATYRGFSDSATLTVEPAPQPDGPNFQVTAVTSNSPVQAGQTLVVNVSVENTGDRIGTQDVSLTLDGLGTSITNVTLPSGATATTTFTFATNQNAVGTYNATASTANDTGSTTVEVIDDSTPSDPANFQVTGVSTDGPVTEGENVTVSATIENTGDEAGTQDVALNIADASDTQPVFLRELSVDLNAGETTTVTLSWTTDSGDAAYSPYTMIITTANDTGSTQVAVNPPQVDPANFQVTGVSSNSPVDAGDDLTVDVSIENTGDQAGTQDVSLSVGALGSATRSVSLNAGASTTETFTFGTASGDEGTYTAEATTANDTGSTTVSVSTPGVTVTDITVTLGSMVLQPGETTSASVSATYTDGTTQDVTNSVSLSSDKPSVASVSGTTVTAQSEGIANITASYQGVSGGAALSVGGDIPYQSFTAWVEDGYITVGNNTRTSQLPECENGVAPNASVECIKFVASFDSQNGTYTVQPEHFQYPVQSFPSEQLVYPANASIEPTEAIEGTIDVESGTGTFSADLHVTVVSVSDDCGMNMSVSGTTGTSGSLTGEPGALQADGTAEPTLVDGTFTVPKATGSYYTCGAVNPDIGLPAYSGQNKLVQEMYMEFHRDPVSEVVADN